MTENVDGGQVRRCITDDALWSLAFFDAAAGTRSYGGPRHMMKVDARAAQVKPKVVSRPRFLRSISRHHGCPVRRAAEPRKVSVL